MSAWWPARYTITLAVHSREEAHKELDVFEADSAAYVAKLNPRRIILDDAAIALFLKFEGAAAIAGDSSALDRA